MFYAPGLRNFQKFFKHGVYRFRRMHEDVDVIGR